MSDAQSRFKDGFKAYAAGDYAAAIAGFQAALEVEPDHRDALRSIAMAWVRHGDPARAVPFAQRVAELEPNDPMSWSGLSLVLMKAGRPKDAEDAAAKAKVQTWKVQLKQKPADAQAPSSSLQVLDSPTGGANPPSAPVMPSAPIMPKLQNPPPPRFPDDGNAST